LKSDIAIAESTPNIPEIVRRYANGESMQTLAAEHGVNRTTIYRWMLSEQGDKHAETVTQVLINRVAEADHRLEVAEDVCNIARAREMARFARMDLERRRPTLYGQRQQITHDIGPDLGNMLRDARKRVADTTHAAVLSPVTIDNDTQTPD
jgi:transcriptional regulator with XRE-family HTH domain